MTAPSNANTSGLEVVAWSQGSLTSTDPICAETAGWDGLVTAASAERAVQTASMMMSALSETINVQMRRATAAEARADRAEARIAEIATMFGVCDGGRYLNDWKARLAALQQETQP